MLKRGDVVRCVGVDTNHDELTVGEKYIINRIYVFVGDDGLQPASPPLAEPHWVEVMTDAGILRMYGTRYFESLEE